MLSRRWPERLSLGKFIENMENQELSAVSWPPSGAIYHIDGVNLTIFSCRRNHRLNMGILGENWNIKPQYAIYHRAISSSQVHLMGFPSCSDTTPMFLVTPQWLTVFLSSHVIPSSPPQILPKSKTLWWLRYNRTSRNFYPRCWVVTISDIHCSKLKTDGLFSTLLIIHVFIYSV